MNLVLALATVKGKPQALGLVNYDCEDVHKALLSSSTVNAIITLVYSKFARERYYGGSCASVIGVKI